MFLFLRNVVSDMGLLAFMRFTVCSMVFVDSTSWLQIVTNGLGYWKWTYTALQGWWGIWVGRLEPHVSMHFEMFS